MSETSNIASMASKISNEIFAVFGWQRRGGLDQNWACVRSHAPKKSKTPEVAEGGSDGATTKTHPSDVVFRYDDPYIDRAVYVTVDLKSYQANSISPASVGKALKSLCRSTECANGSTQWAELYAAGDDEWRAYGMLFVYNHDDVYAPEKFTKLVEEATPAQVRMTGKNRVFVVGPGDITYLHTVANDLRSFRGDQSGGVDFSWFAPDLVRRRSKATFGSAASIETLLGPWMIAGVSPRGGAPGAQRLRIYYRERGATVEEFEHLIEFLFRFRLLDYEAIDLLFAGADGSATGNFEKAVDRVVRDLFDLKEFRERLARVRPGVVTTTFKSYDPRAIGMERNV